MRRVRMVVMKAEKMFEELGFMQVIESYGPDQFVITYHSMRRDKYDASIGFNIKDKTVHTVDSFSLLTEFNIPAYMEITKAIRKQLEELGWIE